ncbi:hypothetical protein KW797_01440 [Candidatus Parcubacteria bacterium]|nr:hypothetical protein [Candidatus Parcubacteria bacterium]
MSILTANAIEAGGKTFVASVRMLGAITVAFFVLLAALLYFMFFTGDRLISAHNIIDQKLDRIEGKIDNAVAQGQYSNQLQTYLLRQICINGADTEAKRNACNPSPASILQRADAN